MMVKIGFVISKQARKYHHPSRQFVMTLFFSSGSFFCDYEIPAELTALWRWILSASSSSPSPSSFTSSFSCPIPHLYSQVHQGDVPAWRFHAVKPCRPGHHQHLQTAAGGQVCAYMSFPSKWRVSSSWWSLCWQVKEARGVGVSLLHNLYPVLTGRLRFLTCHLNGP